jgi:hypothetical protein
VLKEHLPIKYSAIAKASLQLATPPAAETGTVKAWDEPVTRRLATARMHLPQHHHHRIDQRSVYAPSPGTESSVFLGRCSLDALSTKPRDNRWMKLVQMLSSSPLNAEEGAAGRG